MPGSFQRPPSLGPRTLLLGGVREHPLPARRRRQAHPSTCEAAIERLTRLHLRQVGLGPLIRPAWAYGHNMSRADALYVALAEHLGAGLLTDDLRLADAPTFPATVPVLRLSVR